MDANQEKKIRNVLSNSLCCAVEKKWVENTTLFLSVVKKTVQACAIFASWTAIFLSAGWLPRRHLIILHLELHLEVSCTGRQLRTAVARGRIDSRRVADVIILSGCVEAGKNDAVVMLLVEDDGRRAAAHLEITTVARNFPVPLPGRRASGKDSTGISVWPATAPSTYQENYYLSIDRSIEWCSVQTIDWLIAQLLG